MVFFAKYHFLRLILHSITFTIAHLQILDCFNLVMCLRVLRLPHLRMQVGCMYIFMYLFYFNIRN